MKLSSEQLKQIHVQLENYKKPAPFYKVEYLKFMIHPFTPDNIYLKIRTTGVSDGRPFDDLTYMSIDILGNVTDLSHTFQKLQDRVHFTSEMREVKLVAGNIEFV